MAITKLMHMKEEPKYPSAHLIKTINYVLDVEHDGAKTGYGVWVGGNVGTEADEVYHQFMETKKAFNKELGRQGYHFVISFAPGEVDEQVCFDVLKDFCEEYLGDKFEYVYAVHNDQDHMHGHIVFNSVSRMDGYKYRYEKGDWKKYIQPITDKISVKYGVSPLVFSEKKKGMSYADWADEKKGKLNWTHIIRADVDYAIENSSNMEEFFSFIKKLGYEFRMGYSRKRDETYITFSMKDENGNVHRRRSYNLLKGTDEYSLEKIAAKIKQNKLQEPFYETVFERTQQKANLYLGNTAYMRNYKTFNRLYQAVNYYKLPNPFAVPAYKVRQDMVRLDKLIEECAYLKRNPNKSLSELKERRDFLDNHLKTLYIDRKSLRQIEEDIAKKIEPDILLQYKQLKQRLSNIEEWEDTWEVIEDEIEKLENKLPVAFINSDEKLRSCERQIELFKKERRVLDRVIESESDNERTVALNQSIQQKPK